MDKKTICLTFLDEVHNKHNLAAIDEFVAHDVISHDPMPGQKPGIEGVKETIGMFNAAFPDKRITINDTLTENDKVMVKLTCFGTHKGEFMGLPGTNNSIQYEEVLIFRLADDKIVEHWAVADVYGFMQQIGAIAQN